MKKRIFIVGIIVAAVMLLFSCAKTEGRMTEVRKQIKSESMIQ